MFSLKLKQNLFSPNWEIRHGSACALREIVKIHGKSAGCSSDIDESLVCFTSANVSKKYGSS